jgi:IS1 family transposase
MNKLSSSKRTHVVACLVEGNSIRATCRMTGVAKGTVLKLLADLGEACAVYQDKALRDLRCKRIQCDEIWSFVGMKRNNVPQERWDDPSVGDMWTWTALDADSKLMVSWRVGARDSETAHAFVQDLASRLANRVQLTTDGYNMYLAAVEEAFGNDIDYGMLVKIYAADAPSDSRYSPAICTGARKQRVAGHPVEAHVSTSYVERQNLTMRMSMRRFTRLTNAFSKKVENLSHAVALHFMHYNFARVHQTLRVTPAMEAGVADHVWSIAEIVALLDAN